jgi:hypothetical protein
MQLTLQGHVACLPLKDIYKKRKHLICSGGYKSSTAKKKIQAPQVIEKIVETSLNLFSILKYTLNSLYLESEQKNISYY